ncbi:hypothetical protein Ae706Ps2_3185c [Pseudonocardia sp. Ae706_Ps2]|nr:hypothetical protein Ae505Ps2_2056 [Pseudonocardia sp. Ae505_Ps2]OLM24752.1 hypothetical protein Ae706Ps2_3185c [Pseudonocardia sp. Ae706_Ps2]
MIGQVSPQDIAPSSHRHRRGAHHVTSASTLLAGASGAAYGRFRQ